MLAMIVVSLLLIVGVGRLPAIVLALGSLSVFAIVQPVLLGAGIGAFVVAGAFLWMAVRWVYPAMTEGVKPVRVLWVTPRFTLAMAYA